MSKHHDLLLQWICPQNWRTGLGPFKKKKGGWGKKRNLHWVKAWEKIKAKIYIERGEAALTAVVTLMLEDMYRARGELFMFKTKVITHANCDLFSVWVEHLYHPLKRITHIIPDTLKRRLSASQNVANTLMKQILFVILISIFFVCGNRVLGKQGYFVWWKEFDLFVRWNTTLKTIRVALSVVKQEELCSSSQDNALPLPRAVLSLTPRCEQAMGLLGGFN